MRLRMVGTIFRKELVESLRDRRTLFMMIGLPLLLYPLLLVGMGMLQERQSDAQAARASRVAVWGELPADMAAQLTTPGRMELRPWAGASPSLHAKLAAGAFATPPSVPLGLEADDAPARRAHAPDTPWALEARRAILGRTVDAVLIVWPGSEQRVRGGDLAVVSVLSDAVRPDSRKALDRVSERLGKYRETLRKERERQRALPAGFSATLEIQTTDVATDQRRSGMLLGMLLPYMLIMFSVMAGFYAAIDMTAGEKERGTMQTLLCAPVGAMEIIGGKFLAVWTISTIATVVNLASLALTFSQLSLIPGMKLSVPLSSYFVAFPILLPLSLMVNALLLAVGAFARDFKDGQNFLTPILLGLMVPLMAAMTPGIELNGFLAFAPVVNVALLIKGVFVGEWTGELLFLVMLSSLCYASIALAFAAHVFERNSVLLGEKESLGSVFDFSRRPGARPSPGVSLLAFTVVLVALFYASMALMRFGLPVLLVTTQYGLFLLPVVLLVRLKGYDMRDVLSLRRPSARAVAAAVLVGISAWTVVAGLLVRLLPPPESVSKGMEQLLLLGDKPIPLWGAWLLIAVTPAVCEETFFRGLVLGGFRRLGKWPAILATGLLFGLAHASIYRLLPTVVLGVLLGFVVWRTRSIAASMIVHALNNGIVVTIARSGGLVRRFGLEHAQFIPWPVIGAGAVVLAAGLWLLGGEPAPPAPGGPDPAP